MALDLKCRKKYGYKNLLTSDMIIKQDILKDQETIDKQIPIAELKLVDFEE